jgi:hypothetical protein
MYVSAYDPMTHTQVNLHGRGSFSPEAFERAAEEAERFLGEAQRRGAVARWLAIVSPECETPNAAQRKRIAEIKDQGGPVHIATVATSLIHRGVMTALQWLAPHRPGQHVVTVSTVEEGLTWHENMAGRPLPVLRKLTAQVTAEAGRQGNSRLAG